MVGTHVSIQFLIAAQETLLPRSYKLAESALQAETCAKYEYHLCPNQDCPHATVWDPHPDGHSGWLNCRDDACAACGSPRFTCSEVSGKPILTPNNKFWDLGVSNVIKYDFFMVSLQCPMLHMPHSVKCM